MPVDVSNIDADNNRGDANDVTERPTINPVIFPAILGGLIHISFVTLTP